MFTAWFTAVPTDTDLHGRYLYAGSPLGYIGCTVVCVTVGLAFVVTGSPADEISDKCTAGRRVA